MYDNSIPDVSSFSCLAGARLVAYDDNNIHTVIRQMALPSRRYADSSKALPASKSASTGFINGESSSQRSAYCMKSKNPFIRIYSKITTSKNWCLKLARN